ncbi:NAD(P)H-binding protein [Spirosoma sp. KUDC1026]|uniref:NAD(P)H-binding protein n=1 Tax=Spirosoma sp. KUDC1026 TaxID=2745947 RepID=UPI00159B9687|nr:NAD(P)H-binding protein [Spirosoma sp. KUDC1026]QKZ12578.1 NAD(P)H-binding protein [Spirosoma sp. KUDC1026]
MNIIVTGSLGHISQPLTQHLVQKGHTVTVISSSPDRQADIEALGAKAAIGSVEDAEFLANTFSGADVVYCMIPPAYFSNPTIEPTAFYRNTATAYALAIRQSGVNRAIHLSSFGADLDHGTGFILGSHNAESILNKLSDVAITHVRPTSFYYNLFGFIGQIKHTGQIAANYGADDVIPMVSPKDIATAIADEVELPAEHRKIRYVSSDEPTGHEVAASLGDAIGKPDLQWVLISNEDMLTGLTAAGIPAHLAAGMVELYESLHSGRLQADYNRNKPVLGQVKLNEFAADFAAAFNQQPQH